MSRRPLTGVRCAAGRTARAVGFLGHFGVLFLRANAAIAWEISTPGCGLAPAIVALRRPGRTPLETALMAHLITLTPGTLVLEVRTEPSTLYVHGMHAADSALFLERLVDLENRLLAVLRPSGGDRG